MEAFLILIVMVLDIAWWVIIVHVIMSWLINFNVINLYQPFVRQVWDVLNRLTEPVYRPIRNILPNLGGIDLSPIVVLLAVIFLRNLVLYDIRPALG